MGDSGRERCKIREVRFDIDRVEISEDFSVRFVGQRSVEGGADIDDRGYSMSNFVSDRSGQTLRLSVALQISQLDKLALQIILLEVHRADLDEDLELVLNEDITEDGNIAIGSLVLGGDLRRNAKNKRSAGQKW
jgi:hypothetical protein